MSRSARLPSVVIVTAGIRSARNASCSVRLRGKPRSMSWASVPAVSGRLPVSSSSAAVATTRRRRARPASRDLEPRRLSRRDRVEHDDGHDMVGLGRAGEPARTEQPVGAGVCRGEEQRVAGADSAGRGPRSRVRARELDQRRRSGRVVVRTGMTAGGVAMCDDEDRVPGAAGNRGTHVSQIHPAPAGDVHGEAVDPCRQPERRQLPGHPGSGAGGGGSARRTVGMQRRELLREPVRGGIVERGLDCRSRLRQGRRPGDRECRRQERDGDDDPGHPVQAPADRALDRAGTCPAPAAGGGEGLEMARL